MTPQDGKVDGFNTEASGTFRSLIGPARLGQSAAGWPAGRKEHGIDAAADEEIVAPEAAVPSPSLKEGEAKAPHVSHPIDSHVGARVRLRRQLLGLNQKELAAALGLSFQQIQKFERGKDRIAASRLYDIANALNVPISFFFDAIPVEASVGRATTDASPEAEQEDERLKETLNLVRAYRNVRDPALRKRILDLVRSMG